MKNWTELKLPLVLTIFSQFYLRELNSAKILFFFAGGTYSHKNGIWPLVSALADKGHNVTLLSPQEKRPWENPRVNDLAPLFIQNFMTGALDTEKLQSRKDGTENLLWFKVPLMTNKICTLIAEEAKKNGTILNSILYDKNNSYDLIIINAVFSECGVMWAYHHKTRFIIAVSTSIFPWLPELYGLPIESSWLPDLALQFQYPMQFYDRLKNYVWTLYMDYERRRLTSPVVESLMKDTFQDRDGEVPSLIELERRASLVLVNTYSGSEFARGLPPFIKQIGGMQCWAPQKPLPSDLKKYMDDGDDGVILITFGSTIDFSKIPGSFHKIFFDAMKEFPRIRFIWKWSGDQPGDKPGNLLFSKWLPQMEILGHPKLLAFVTHCGLNSVMEATFQGVPFIGIPLFGDQDYNAYHIKVHKLGIVLEARDLTTVMMIETIRDITKNNLYKNNMKKVSAIFKDRPMSPIDTAVFWTEFVLRNKDTDVLKPLNHQQPWWQRRFLDVSAFLLISFVIVCLILGCIVKLIFMLVTRYHLFLRCSNALAGDKNPGKKKM